MSAGVDRIAAPTAPLGRASAGGVGLGATVWLGRAVLLGLILGGWQYGGSRDEFWQMVFSTPVQVAGTVSGWLMDPTWWPHLAATLEEAALGYLLGAAVALLLVAVLAPNPVLGAFLRPFLAALNALPKVALAPLFIFWFGIQIASKTYFVASVITFILFQGILSGLATIDGDLLANIRLMGASRIALLRQVYIPAIIGWIVASLRLSSAWALLSAVLAEYIGSNKGLGYLIATGQQSLRADAVIAGILVIAFVSLAMDRLLLRGEQHMTRWRAQ